MLLLSNHYGGGACGAAPRHRMPAGRCERDCMLPFCSHYGGRTYGAAPRHHMSAGRRVEGIACCCVAVTAEVGHVVLHQGTTWYGMKWNIVWVRQQTTLAAAPACAS